MGTIHPQITGGLVHFVFDEIEGTNFDKSIYALRWMRTHFKTMPGMRSPPVEGLWKVAHNSDLLNGWMAEGTGEDAPDAVDNLIL